MFNTILIPTDGSELAEKAVHAAIEFARAGRAKLIGLAVAESFPYAMASEAACLSDLSSYNEGRMELARESLGKAAAAAERAGISFQTVAVSGADPAEEIVKVARERRCDLIFIASHGRRGIGRMLLGSVTQKVLAGATIPVLVMR